MIHLEWSEVFDLFNQPKFQIKTEVLPGSVHINGTTSDKKAFVVQGKLYSTFTFPNGLTFATTNSYTFDLKPDGKPGYFNYLCDEELECLTDFYISGPEHETFYFHREPPHYYSPDCTYNPTFHELLLAVEEVHGQYPVRVDESYTDCYRTMDYWHDENAYDVACAVVVPDRVLISDVVSSILERPEGMKKQIGFALDTVNIRPLYAGDMLLTEITGDFVISSRIPSPAFTLNYRKPFTCQLNLYSYEKPHLYEEREPEYPWCFSNTVVWRYINENDIDILYNGANLSIEDQYRHSTFLFGEMIKYVPLSIPDHKLLHFKKYQFTDTHNTVETRLLTKLYEYKYGNGMKPSELMDRKVARKNFDKIIKDDFKKQSDQYQEKLDQELALYRKNLRQQEYEESRERRNNKKAETSDLPF